VFTSVTLKRSGIQKCLPYIFAEKKGIHIIDLNKTVECLQETAAALKAGSPQREKNPFCRNQKTGKRHRKRVC
jgi:small subunit ribosomal protein S2